MEEKNIGKQLKCYHCGQRCEDLQWSGEKAFCCFGCKTIYEVLNANNLCEYYDIEKNPGVQQKKISDETYAYLDESEIRTKLLAFDSPDFAKVTFYIPSIHCVSCIWLLENLQKLGNGVLRSEVIFTKKTVTVDFNPQLIKVSEIAGLIASLGYIPQITLDTTNAKREKSNNALVLKLAVAGFCFGNVMLFSFPEYLGIDHSQKTLMRIFSFLNLALSIPAFFYSGFDYLRSAVKSFRQKQINIDLPIAAGLIALLLRSAYDIISSTGPGYLDSFTGLIFFLLIGRWFQGKTYESLAFDRDFSAYFPLAVNILKKESWKPIVVHNLERGDRMRIRNMELVPADSRLQNEVAWIDYSFVTGESKPVKVKQNDLIYAGGRLIGAPIELIVENKTSQSHLTSLWNNDAFRKTNENKYQKIIDRAARRFTITVLFIAFTSAIYWQLYSPSQMWLILTSVLMVACPCALALAAPFTFGSMLRVLGRNKLYLKNADVIERMSCINAVVFDKTGTITYGDTPEICFHGDIDDNEMSCVKTLTGYSTHPLSVYITGSIKSKINHQVLDFQEIPGKGIQANVDGKNYLIGSADFVKERNNTYRNGSFVFVKIDDEIKGYFTIRSSIREQIRPMIERLGNKCVALISGDNDADKSQMEELFHADTKLLFNQSPHDKLFYIRKLQADGKKMMMIGDGLNDAGALKQSDVGIAITDNTGVFTPACDGILAGENIGNLDRMLKFTQSSSPILKTGFTISFFYNAIALGFAVTGHLTPLVAAIIMPVSSISVVGFSTLAVKLSASRLKL